MSGPPHEEKRTEKLPNAFGPYDFAPVGDAPTGAILICRDVPEAGSGRNGEREGPESQRRPDGTAAEVSPNPETTGTGHGCGRKTGAGGANARTQKDGKRQRAESPEKASESQAEEIRAEETGNGGKPGEV